MRKIVSGMLLSLLLDIALMLMLHIKLVEAWTATTPLPIFAVNPLSSVNRQIGVKSGDWVKYRIEGSMADNVTLMIIEVKSIDVQESIVTFNLTSYLYNGTKYSDTYRFNLATGMYVPEYHYFTLVPFIFANLGVGDAPYEPWPNYTIQSEIIKTYCGAKRQVLYLHIDEVSDSTYPVHFIINAYWDKATGALLEFELIYPNDDQTLKIIAIETNLWSTSQQDYTLLYYIGGAIIGLFTVIIVTYFLVRKKSLKPQLPTPPPPPSATVPLQVKRCNQCGSDVH
jgi:hypothetical protein